MAITDFSTKVSVVVREDLAAWQRIDVAAFLISGIAAVGDDSVVGPPYEDADGVRYLPMLRQPVLVVEAATEKLRTVHRRAFGAQRLDRDLHFRSRLSASRGLPEAPARSRPRARRPVPVRCCRFSRRPTASGARGDADHLVETVAASRRARRPAGGCARTALRMASSTVLAWPS